MNAPLQPLSSMATFDPSPLSELLGPLSTAAFVPMSAMSESGVVVVKDVRLAAELTKGYTYFQDGDVLVAKITPCFENGKIGHFRTSERHAFGSTEFHVVRPESGTLDARYLHHFLRTSQVRAAGEKRMTGSAGQRRVPRDFLKQLPIPVPAISEQRRIAAILDQAEALRSKRRQALAKLDTLTQSLFLEMFGDPRTNRKSWPLRRLGEMFAEPPNYGSMIPPSANGAWLSLRVGNIQNWHLDLNDSKYIDLPLRLERRFEVRNADVLLARAIASLDHLGKCVIAHPGKEKWAYDSHLMRLRLDSSSITPEYLCALLQTEGGRSLFLAVTRRSAVQFNINTKEIKSLRVPVPPMSLQTLFQTKLKCSEDVAKVSAVSMNQVDYLFASLQHRAFHGEL